MKKIYMTPTVKVAQMSSKDSLLQSISYGLGPASKEGDVLGNSRSDNDWDDDEEDLW